MCIRESSICFFFKQKTAYEIMPSLVGSEMCIRDSYHTQITDLFHFQNKCHLNNKLSVSSH